MKLLRSLGNSPVETISAFVLVGAGVYVSSVGNSATDHKTGLLAAGGLLTTFGGVLFAWVVAKVFATTQARSEFQQQLGHLSRNLGQAAGQISRAVEQSLAGDTSSETALALISQANRMIYGQVSEISVIQETGFDPAYLLDTVTTLDDLARKLESDSDSEGELEQVRRQLKAVRTSLSNAAPSRTYSQATVECPHCTALNEVELGDFRGDTAASSCVECGARFNAHRGSGGAAFSRAVGPASRGVESPPTERWRFACPSCGHSASAWSNEGRKTMVCFGCYRSLDVDTDTRTVELGAGQFNRHTALVVGRSGSRPLVQCPVCSSSINAFIQKNDQFIGICYRDLQLLEVPRSDFEAWVNGSDGSGAPVGSGDGAVPKI